MISKIWEKKIVAVISMAEEDICDSLNPLPLIIHVSWNHYVGFYSEEIFNFFLSFAPFPIRKEEFHLRLKGSEAIIEMHEIVSHIIAKHSISLSEPIQMVCHFRRREDELLDTNLKRYFKNNLKASTAIRYGKYGASIMTVEMSINNVDDMFTAFKEGNLEKYLGSLNFESDDLGYSFLIHRSQKIPIKIIGKDFLIQRSSSKSTTLSQFLSSVFGEYSVPIKMHGVELKDFDVQIWEIEKYCHPDGYLYLHV